MRSSSQLYLNKIISGQRNFKLNISNFVVSTVPADVLATFMHIDDQIWIYIYTKLLHEEIKRNKRTHKNCIQSDTYLLTGRSAVLNFSKIFTIEMWKFTLYCFHSHWWACEYLFLHCYATFCQKWKIVWFLDLTDILSSTVHPDMLSGILSILCSSVMTQAIYSKRHKPWPTFESDIKLSYEFKYDLCLPL